jgi:hypothetical protein
MVPCFVWVLLDTEDGGTTFLLNVRNYSPIDAVSFQKTGNFKKTAVRSSDLAWLNIFLKAKDYTKGKSCWREFE